MLKAIRCDTREHTFHRLHSVEQIKEAREDPDSILWLDLLKPTEQDFAIIAEKFQLHPLAIEDATVEHQRPKVEEYEHFDFVVFYAVNMNGEKGDIDTCEIDMFLGSDYLITTHQEPAQELDEAEQRWTRNAKQMEWGIGILLYSLLDSIVDHYFPVVDELVERAEALEDRLFEGHTRERKFAQELLSLRKQFLTLRRVAAPERDVLNVLTNRDNPIFDEHASIYFRDVYDHITRLADTVDLYRDQLSTTMDANLSIVSNDLNKVMRTLTSASIILMADSLIAGIYGMNFVNIPELHWSFGYFYCLALMLVVSLLLVAVFRRLRWF